MKIDIQVIVGDECLSNELLTIRGIYDPKGLMSKYRGSVVNAILELRVSKKGNFVAVLKEINEI